MQLKLTFQEFIELALHQLKEKTLIKKEIDINTRPEFKHTDGHGEEHDCYEMPDKVYITIK